MGASTTRFASRESFSKIPAFVDVPDLLSIQTKAYQQFLQEWIPQEAREQIGLEGVFNNVFPIEDSHRNYILEYKTYYLGQPKYTPDECMDRGVTYSAPLRVRMALHITDENNKSEYAQSIEQDVYFGNIPYMTSKGTFIINGAERVIVSQLQRSPGVFFDESIHPNGTKLFQARIIPARGSWVDFTTDINDCLFVIIDRRRKFPVTMLLRALGYSTNTDIFNAFGSMKTLNPKKGKLDQYIGATITEDVVDTRTGEIFFEGGTELTSENADSLKKAGITKISVVDGNKNFHSMLLLNTIEKDPTRSTEEALAIVYQLIRSSEPPNLETAQKFIERIFFSPKKYDLGQVGRYRLNQQFNLKAPVEETVLTMDDIIQVINFLIDMRKGERGVDDIDHLGNRRVKTIGEQLTNQFSVALSRMTRTIHERMNLRESESITPQDLINSRVVTTVISTFFGTSQLSQFGDQTNPLAEITHKRRISALGPGGLTRERAGFEVRDVHYTHYGRLCPIETPEGPNIGLISSLAMFAEVNDHGFIESPYRKVRKNSSGSIITNKIEYLSADDEDRVLVSQASTKRDESGIITEDKIRARMKGDFPIVEPKDVDFVEVSPNQILSVAAALIPFLEHDDANRALMGSNMQRQAVPLMKPQSPIVGTGIEAKVAVDSRSALVSPVDGRIIYVDSEKVRIKRKDVMDSLALYEGENVIEIKFKKFHRTNQNTVHNQRPLLSEGTHIKKGDVIADGAATQLGELALGSNIRVAFMPWRGYNFEDAIVLSERLVKEDVFSSIHCNEIELEVRDTKRGQEELTSEIPNVSEESTKDLDESGIIRVGARVKEGNILIGKVTPKGETDPTPEEKLLRAIFGEKAGEVKDASKKAEPGIKGVVIKTQLFEKQAKRTKKEEREQILLYQKSASEQKKLLKLSRDEKLTNLLKDQISNGIRDLSSSKTLIKKSTKLTLKRLTTFDMERFAQDEAWVEDKAAWKKIKAVWRSFREEWGGIETRLERKIFKLRVGDELQPGILKLAKVFVAQKRKISVGDKMAGRHGNKGIVAIIVPEEDMPFMEDGSPVDVVLNPLGVPSRMNLGQLYETMLGWVGEITGRKFATPVFDGATPEDVANELKAAGLPASGKARLIDGRTGEYLDNPVTVGNIYMMKLSHMVDDKMHARSTGPYSLITQQPLGGKAQFGGQRFGEMEVWALQAYGAAHTLHELLTVKSDDVEGRSKVYNSIVRGEQMPEFSSPESFNVMIKELQGLCIDVELD
ncbi:MAG: DNA-directed RNA polymerase subunit beta [Candidatus Marinimicrobia bacterium]|nr:DNA-directed RNA polymerase subunit beta [Candidatus Neomarinimicrobiota bacterium]MBT4155483.1 DNA-directed RNA polymerase subunit beta [Candidatus Neomarinimicrobiota bacterium]MBT4555273.1 DNA-directed RNA polymerase subunit beta [Candidatus Neomarinimicrobiota bacterium]MBT5115566.1 DNA-directed RNA polymerase subunit beta [Candidatus Neomarinimicrobiota bacterium]MBT7945860.1 DNA-directed RNA polymerase subunit beta [Candidatus Neomarinimicrobiota bacterium]